LKPTVIATFNLKTLNLKSNHHTLFAGPSIIQPESEMKDMSSAGLEGLSAMLQKSTLSPSGPSFEGRGLKLNDENDANIVVNEMAKFKNTLDVLNLAGNTLGVDACKAIGKELESHPEFKYALWKDMFTGRMKEEIPQALRFLGVGLVLAKARLVELDLSDNAFGPIGIGGLVTLLKSDPCFSLQILRLNNNGLGISGGKLLAKSLLECYESSGKQLALKIFIAGRNRLENDGTKALAQVFQTMGTLQEIAMPQNGIYAPGHKALGEALLKCPELRVLNLNDNCLARQGAVHIAEALPTLTELKSVNFGDCLLKSDGAMLVAKALQSNQKLEEVIFSFDEIHSRALSDICNSMRGKVNLKSLDLEGNLFGRTGKNILSNFPDVPIILGGGGDDDDEDDDDEEEEESEEEDEEEGQIEEERESDSAEENSNVNESIRIEDSPAKEVSIDQFLQDPSTRRFQLLGKERYTKTKRYIEGLSDADMITKGVEILMSVSSSAASNDEKIKSDALEICMLLYTRLFDWAKLKDSVSLLDNSLLVNLQLIKAEDNNKYKPVLWNIEGCYIALEKICNQNMLPEATKDILKVFLQRQTVQSNRFSEAKSKLLAAL
jgi:Ran GTPase-activating protein 1